MENGAFAPWEQILIFHNIFKNLVFQRCQKVLLLSKGLSNVVPQKLQEEMQWLT